jgi:hypothetical protein
VPGPAGFPYNRESTQYSKLKQYSKHKMQHYLISIKVAMECCFLYQQAIPVLCWVILESKSASGEDFDEGKPGSKTMDYNDSRRKLDANSTQMSKMKRILIVRQILVN